MLFTVVRHINKFVIYLFYFVRNWIIIKTLITAWRLSIRVIITLHAITEYYLSRHNEHYIWKKAIEPRIDEIYLFFNDYWVWKTSNSNYFKPYQSCKVRGFLFDKLLLRTEDFLNLLTKKIPKLENYIHFQKDAGSPHLNGVFCMLVDISVLTVLVIILSSCYKFIRWYFTPPKKWSSTPIFNISTEFSHLLVLTIFWISFFIIIFITYLYVFYVYWVV